MLWSLCPALKHCRGKNLCFDYFFCLKKQQLNLIISSNASGNRVRRCACPIPPHIVSSAHHLRASLIFLHARRPIPYSHTTLSRFITFSEPHANDRKPTVNLEKTVDDRIKNSA
jgi:hypothetical protein